MKAQECEYDQEMPQPRTADQHMSDSLPIMVSCPSCKYLNTADYDTYKIVMKPLFAPHCDKNPVFGFRDQI